MASEVEHMSEMVLEPMVYFVIKVVTNWDLEALQHFVSCKLVCYEKTAAYNLLLPSLKTELLFENSRSLRETVTGCLAIRKLGTVPGFFSPHADLCSGLHV